VHIGMWVLLSFVCMYVLCVCMYVCMVYVDFLCQCLVTNSLTRLILLVRAHAYMCVSKCVRMCAFLT